MAELYNISHANELVQSKVNFFANYFDFVCKNVGILDELELETHTSLIDKLIFQLSNNSQSWSKKYIHSYINHALLKSDHLIKEFQAYSQFKSLITKHKSNLVYKDILKATKALRKELSSSYVDSILSTIISFLTCIHKLAVHRTELKYYTKLLVCEFILNGKSKNDLEDLLHKILSSDKIEFPFPTNITTDEQKDHFLSNRTFKQQFEGIKNYMYLKERTHYYLYRVGGYEVSDDFIERYNKVTFISKNHKKLKKLRNRLSKTMLAEDFLDSYPLVAYIKIPSRAIDIASQEARNLIKSELEYLNLVLSGDAYIEPFNFLYSPDFNRFRFNWNKKGGKNIIDEYEIVKIQDNPYKFLRNIKLISKKRLLNLEPLAIKAFSTNSNSAFWHYLEVLIQKDAANVINFLANILLNEAKESKKRLIGNYIHFTFLNLNNSPSDFGIDESLYMDIRKNFYTIDFKVYKKYIKENFVHDLIGSYLHEYKKNDFTKLHEYYKSVLLESYEQRNFYIHKANEMTKAAIKLSISMAEFTKRIRWSLFRGIREYNGLKFDTILVKLEEEGKALLS